MNNNRIVKKPRVKGIKEEHRFWCYYHKRFFDEEKRITHCIPKGCFKFNHNYFTWRMCTQKDNDIECSGFGDREEISEVSVRKEIGNQGLTLRLTESQRRFLKRSLGREVKGVLIRGDLNSTAKFDNINSGMDSLSSHTIGFPEY